jgi:hypothetical protein
MLLSSAEEEQSDKEDFGRERRTSAAGANLPV